MMKRNEKRPLAEVSVLLKGTGVWRWWKRGKGGHFWDGTGGWGIWPERRVGLVEELKKKEVIGL